MRVQAEHAAEDVHVDDERYGDHDATHASDVDHGVGDPHDAEVLDYVKAKT